MASVNWLEELHTEFADEIIHTKQTYVKKMSQDYYWYSPVLKKLLAHHSGDCVIAPRDEEELISVLSFAYKRKVPIVSRGGGTGNYGQIVPLYGGIVLDTSKLNKVLDVKEEQATFQAGCKLGVIEKTLREHGQELRFYPSTFMKSTLAGFIAGGTGGIGSIQYGTLWDEGNVLQLSVVTMEEKPRKINVTKKEELTRYIHSYGISGIITEATIATAKKTDWHDMIVYFDELQSALLFSEEMSRKSHIKKRLVSVCEAPLSSVFKPLRTYGSETKATVLIQVDPDQRQEVMNLTLEHGGETPDTFAQYVKDHNLRVSDFSWNHVTLWWLKQNEADTYLQGRFDPYIYLDQVKQLKACFQDEVLIHFEWIKVRGKVVPSSQPVIRYTTDERLHQIIDAFEELGIKVSNPHTYLLEEGGKDDWIDDICIAKKQNDPYSLLNPGKTKYIVEEGIHEMAGEEHV